MIRPDIERGGGGEYTSVTRAQGAAALSTLKKKKLLAYDQKKAVGDPGS